MKAHRLDLSLLDGASFSRDPGHTGDHRTHDRIPGANLWGLVCSGLYAAADPLADAVAHSGLVQFGDAYPLAANGTPAWPVPLCLHHDKAAAEGPWHEAGQLSQARVYNGLHFDLAALGQARALRGGYVSAAGHWEVPATDLQLSTAIESTAESGARAAESTLHGQASLRRHRQFRAEIGIGGDTEAQHQQLAAAVWRQLGPIGTWREVSLGRGKGVHYGRARLRVSAAPVTPLPSAAIDGWLTLWLLSDACLRDGFGLPTLCPDGVALGLPAALAAQLQLDPARCFVRQRRHSAYNRHRACHGLERQCIEAGSVLSYRLSGSDASDIRARLGGGIGTAPELGFGRVWVDPPLLAGARFMPVVLPGAAVESVQPEALPPALATARNAGLVRWATALASAGRLRHTRADWVARQVAEFSRLIEQSRRFMGADASLPHGPRRSQWGQVEQIVRDAQDQAAAQRHLFADPHAALAPRADSPWHIEAGHAQAAAGDAMPVTPKAWWQARLEDAPGDDWPARQQALCLLCRALREADAALPGACAPTPAGAAR